MQDVCWIHSKYYKFGEQCPDCLKKEEEYKRSLAVDQEEPPSKVKTREPGDLIWGTVKTLVLVNVVLWIMVILGAILLTGQ
jgi:hypothetical protein